MLYSCMQYLVNCFFRATLFRLNEVAKRNVLLLAAAIEFGMKVIGTTSIVKCMIPYNG